MDKEALVISFSVPHMFYLVLSRNFELSSLFNLIDLFDPPLHITTNKNHVIH